MCLGTGLSVNDIAIYITVIFRTVETESGVHLQEKGVGISGGNIRWKKNV